MIRRAAAVRSVNRQGIHCGFGLRYDQAKTRDLLQAQQRG